MRHGAAGAGLNLVAGRARERRLPPRDLHARQRHGGGGGREPPGARSSRTGSGTRSAPPTARPASPGLPHFLEHLMFKGTGEIPPGEFSKIVARLGGNDNAMTSYDSTAYFQMIAKDRLELVMAMEADRMVNLDLADEHVYPERDVILEERRSRVDNEPSALLGEQLMAAQYLHHPYRLPVIGWFHEIAGYTPRGRARLLSRLVRAQQRGPGGRRRRHRGRAAPAGRAELRQDRRRATVPPRRRLAEPPQHAERRITLHHERVRQPTPDALLSGAELRLGRPRARLRARAPGRDPGRRRHQPAVPRGGGRAGPGGRRRVLLPRHRPGWRRPSASMPARAPASTWPTSRARSMAEVAKVLADGVTANELARTRQRLLAEADLRPRLAGRCGARVRRGADLRRGRGRCRGLAGADRRRDRSSRSTPPPATSSAPSSR